MSVQKVHVGFGCRQGRGGRGSATAAACLVATLLCFGAGGLSAQQSGQTAVGIATFETTDDPRLQVAAESISATIGLTLRLIEGYEVQEIGPWSYTGRAPQAARLRGLDFIVFGAVQDRVGEIVLDLSVYSRAENAVTDQHQDAVSSVFDLFDASDEAATALLESLSGEVIRFATLRLRNEGSPGEYAVFIDDVPVGRNLSELRVLVGNRSVRITQQRMFEEFTVYEGVESLQDGGVRTVEFRIPLATPDERRALVDIEQQILDNWNDPDSQMVVDQLFARAFFLLDDISYSPGLAEYRRSFEELRDGRESEQHQESPQQAQRQKRTEQPDIQSSISAEFVEGGTFQMGSPSGGRDNERPVRSVTVSSFHMARTPTTFEQYDAFARATNRSLPDDRGWGRGDRPVINVSWYDAVVYANWLSEQDGLTPAYEIHRTSSVPRMHTMAVLVSGSREADIPSEERLEESPIQERLEVVWNREANGWRLPTEAEREFAARGGTQSRDYTYAGSNDVNAVAWYRDNSNSRTQPVGEKQANELGLYDLSGNVWEWVWDRFGNYPSTAETDPTGPSTGGDRVLRGGSWIYSASYSRSAYRINGAPARRNSNFGFRLVRSTVR